MKKKLIAITLSLAMAVTMIPSFSFAGEGSDQPAGSDPIVSDPEETADEIADAKDQALTELTGYWGNNEGEKRSSYDEDGQAAIGAAKEAGKVAINDATSTAKVAEALAAAKEVIDAVPTIAEKVEAAKEDAVTTINGYYSAGIDEESYDASYDDESKAAIEAIKADFIDELDDLTTVAAVTEALKTAKAAIDAVPTITGKYTAAKTAAEEAIDAYYGKDGETAVTAEAYETAYDDAVKAAIVGIKSNFKTDIGDVKTAAEVNELLDAAKKAIDEVDTIAEHKVNVQNAIDKYLPAKAVNGIDSYTADDQKAIAQLKTIAKADVYKAETNADMDKVFAEMKETIDAMVTIAEIELAEAKVAAKTEISNYYPEELTDGDYTVAQAESISDIRDKYVAETEGLIDKAESTAEVEELINKAKEEIDAVETKAAMNAKAEAVEAEIANIGAVTISNYNDKYEAIISAEKNYDALEAGADGKDLVDNYDVLTAARAAYDKYKCDEVAGDINALPAINDGNYVENAAKITAIEAKIATIKANNIDQSVKEKLAAAKDNYDAAVADVTAFEKSVTDNLAVLDTVAYRDKATVEAVESEYNNLTETQQSQINADIMAVFTAKVNAIKAFVDEIAAVEEKIDAIPETIEGTDTDKNALEEARAAYEAIKDADAKAAVSAEKITALKTKEAAYVDALISKIGDTTTITNEVIANTDKAKAAYDALVKIDETAAAKVSGVDTLNNALKAIEVFDNVLAQDAKNTAEKAFAAVENITEVTADNKAEVEKAIAAYNAYAAYAPEIAAEAYGDKVASLTELLTAYEEAQAKAEEEALAAAIKKAEDEAAAAAKAEAEQKAAEEAAKAAEKAELEKAEAVAAAEKAAAEKAKAEAEKAAAEKAKEEAEKAVKANLANGKATAAAQVYTGKAVKPAIKVTGSNGEAVSADDYLVVYENNVSVGKATATIIAKSGNKDGYTGYISTTFVITPAKGAISSLKAGSKKFTVKAKAQAGAKYQVAYKLKGAKKYKTVNTSSVSKTIKKLKKGKVYTVKVRAYKSIDGQTYYGSYSKTKNVKVK